MTDLELIYIKLNSIAEKWNNYVTGSRISKHNRDREFATFMTNCMIYFDNYMHLSIERKKESKND